MENGDVDYWKKNLSELKQHDNLVLIHVCDENRQITKDFCCKRNILVEHMKYFEGFLAENDSGYEDIDISVHCDVEIFEWLMTYIHKPNQPPPLEKALVVSILISSDFLQMDSLVDLCVAQISHNLGDIIKLPIDLSCISEKLLNKLAILTPSKLLANTRDRKDKILTKLYKRRVELDFSRKSSGPRGLRSIATSLTCCRNCATMYLDIYSSSLICRSAKAAVAFRGKLVRRHVAVPDWSLTHYLKLLHSSGNLSWEQIYWHVWAACVVLRVNDIVFSVSEVHRYAVEPDGLLVHTKNMSTLDIPVPMESNGSSLGGILRPTMADGMTAISSSSEYTFSLSQEDDLDAYNGAALRMPVSNLLSTDDESCDTAALLAAALNPGSATWGSGLNPLRRPEVLCKDIFELITSQLKVVAEDGNRGLIENLARSSIAASLSKNQSSKGTNGTDRPAVGNGDADRTERKREIKHELWGLPLSRFGNGTRSFADERYSNRGRSLSPANRRSPRQQYRQSQSSTPHSKRGPSPDSNSPAPSLARDSNASAGTGGGGGSGIAGDRRSRSTSSGPSRRTIVRTASSGAATGKLPPKSRGTSQVVSSKIQSPATSPRGGGGTIDSEDDVLDPFETLKCFPAEIQSHMNSHRGPIHGVWLTEHPLSTFPYQYYDMQAYIESFSSVSLPDAKRQEWTFDLLREYDDKRMDGLEDYLLSHRKSVDEQMRFVSGSSSFRNFNKEGVGSERPTKSDTAKGRAK